MEYSNKIKPNQKSVPSVHLCISVLQTNFDVIKAQDGKIKVETKVDEGNPEHFGKSEGAAFIIQLPNS